MGTLREHETLLLWAQFDDFGGPGRKRAERRLCEALEAAPHDPEVHFWQGRLYARSGFASEAVDHYRVALREGPRKAEYLLALAALYGSQDARRVWSKTECSRQLSRVVNELAKVAYTGRQLNAIAVYRLLERDVSTAATLSRRACEIATECWECLHTSAAAAFLSGDHERAIVLEREALSRLPENGPPGAQEVMLETLARYRSAADTERVDELPPLFFPE